MHQRARLWIGGRRYGRAVQHFAADRIDLTQLAGGVLDEDLDPRAPVDQGRRLDERGLDGVNAEVEMPRGSAVAKNPPVAIAADHSELDGVGVHRQAIASLRVRRSCVRS